MKKGLLLITIILGLMLVYAGNFEDKSQGDFSGIYNNTFYNSSGFIQLNASIPGNSTIIPGNVTELIGNEFGLISYWRFNESYWTGVSGEVKDVLGKNNGTVPNITTANTSAGLFGRAGNFTGTPGVYTNEVQIKDASELNPKNDSYTITGWAKSSQKGGANQWHLYVAKRTTAATNGYYIGLLEGSGLNFMVGDEATRYDTRDSGYIPLAYDSWFHFAAVINRTSKQIMLYVNGTLGATRSFTNLNNISNTANLSIGNDEGQAQAGYQYPVRGLVDEVAIWNRALNSSEVLELYQKGTNSSTNMTTNATVFTSGTYESESRDAGSIVSWQNISWNGLQITNNSGIGQVSNPVLLAHLDEISGNITDSSSYSNNGTNNGASYGASGKVGNALSFDGVNDYVNFGNPSHLQITGNITLAAWIKFNQIPSGTVVMDIISKNEAGSYGIIANYAGSGRIETFLYIGGAYKNSGVSLSGLSAGTWYHALAIYNGTSVDFYLDGIKQQSVAASGAISNTAMNVLIGANPGPGGAATEFFNGTIDEVYIFNRSLNSSEIASLSGNSSSNSSLRFQLRTSNDNSTWSNWQGISGEGSYYTYPSSINASNSRYIKYKAYFDDIGEKLYNVTVSYLSSGENISVSLDSPVDNYLTNEYNGINITCSASSTSQLANITPYYSKFGWGQSEPARAISGTMNTTTFTLNEITSEILWNCYACNVNGSCAFSSSNRTIIGDILAPEISLISPDNNYAENSSQNINFIFNAADNRATSLNCKLLVNDTEVASNSSVVSGIQTTISYTLANGNYSWKINCSDGINSAVSEERNLVVNISSAYVPFWAKVNAHTHTTNSDGDSSPATVVGLYQSKGYNILAITDHGYVTNCTPFTNSSFICINSEEWTSTKHVVRINVSSAYNNNAVNLQNAVNAAQNEGGFSIAAHPNWSSTIWSVNELVSLQNYTAMEIYNKVIERLSPDPYAVSKWDDVLKTGKKIFGVASDDMHQVNVDLGYGFTKVYMPEFSKQAYIDSMKTGYFYASQGPIMDLQPFILVCDEADTYHMGETANCSSIRVNATISSTNSSYIMKNVTLIKDGNVLNITTCSSQNCSFSYFENISSSGYYRVQATDSLNKQIWSNPIWVNKIALPVAITVDSPINNSNIFDYTPLLIVSLNQQTSLWYRLNNGNNLSLCSGCSVYSGYITLQEGVNNLSVYANNSDNIVKENRVRISLNFNKSLSENFSDNSSIESTLNATWNSGKMSFGAGNMFGNFILKSIVTLNNITSFHIEWQENNTENAKGEGQRVPIILKYKFGNSDWKFLDSNENYIVNGTTISGLNGNNLSLMFDFEKKPEIPVDLLNFRITWTEFTIPLIFNVSVGSVTSSSAQISWVTDLPSNSSVLYGVTTSLGSSVRVNDSAASHSVTITGLNPATGYFYKVQSCTDSSCSQDPQEPFPPYSFTTQSHSENPPSGGGGGGGGGGKPLTNVSAQVVGIEISGVDELVMGLGESKKLPISVKNAGTKFLNKCRIAARGGASSWVSSTDVKGISPGEVSEFVLSIGVPEDATGDGMAALFVVCDEGNASKDLKISLIKSSLQLAINKVEQKGRVLEFSYSIKNVGSSQDVAVEYWLSDKKQNKVAEGTDSLSIEKNSETSREAKLSLPAQVTGGHILSVRAYSKTDSSYKQETILLRNNPGLLGRVISAESGRIVSIVLFIVFSIAIAFSILRRIIRRPTTEDRAGYVKLKLNQ